MRISTAGLHQSGVNNILRQQSALARVQNQIATNSRMLSAADDPAAAAQALSLDQTLADITTWQSNIGSAQTRLSMEETALSGANDVLDQIRERVLQANSAGQSPQTREQIATELEQVYQQLLSYANSDDGNGRFLFGGSSDANAPFAQTSGGVAYNGDQQNRLLAIGGSRQIADGDAGDAVFLRLKSGNGSFAVQAGAANAGGLQFKSSQVTDAAAWDGGSYSISFSGGYYEVRDAGNAVVAGGPYSAGSAIRFRGIELTLAGAPADGDSLSVAPSAQKDLFATVKDLIAAVRAPTGTAAQRAQQQTAIAQGLMELQAGQDHLGGVRATVGNRLAALDSASSNLDARGLAATENLSDLRDVDLVEASGRLNLAQVILQAAQQSYMKVQGLSLFDFLR